MTSLPWKGIFGGIAGVTLVVILAGFVYQWAIRYDPGGPFSGILSTVSVTGAVALALLGGGLLVAVSWVFGLIPDRGF